jgi:hypothetical protein
MLSHGSGKEKELVLFVRVLLGSTKIGETKHHHSVLGPDMVVNFHESFEIEIIPDGGKSSKKRKQPPPPSTATPAVDKTQETDSGVIESVIDHSLPRPASEELITIQVRSWERRFTGQVLGVATISASDISSVHKRLTIPLRPKGSRTSGGATAVTVGQIECIARRGEAASTAHLEALAADRQSQLMRCALKQLNQLGWWNWRQARLKRAIQVQ